MIQKWFFTELIEYIFALHRLKFKNHYKSFDFSFVGIIRSPNIGSDYRAILFLSHVPDCALINLYINLVISDSTSFY